MSTSAKAQEAKGRAKPWVKWLARFGYAAKGVVYMVVGGLALAAALGRGGSSSPDQRGALRTILEQPFGQVLLGAVAVGLFGYALWRFVMAAEDTEGDGLGRKRYREAHGLRGERRYLCGTGGGRGGAHFGLE